MQQGERLDSVPVQAGELRTGDRGYPQPDGLRATRDGRSPAIHRVLVARGKVVDRAPSRTTTR